MAGKQDTGSEFQSKAAGWICARYKSLLLLLLVVVVVVVRGKKLDEYHQVFANWANSIRKEYA